MSLPKRSLNIPTHDIQPSIVAHFAKKAKMNEDATRSEAVAPSQPTITLEIEVPFPLKPALSTFQHLSAKSATGHSTQKHWFVDFLWLQLAENNPSLYCSSCHWTYKNRRLNVSDLSFLKKGK